MIRRITSITMLVLASLTSSVYSTDYSTMPTEELAKMRGKMQNATVQERNAFRHEWQKRIQGMTPAERQIYTGRPDNEGTGQGMKNQSRQGGSGMGTGFGGGRGGRR